ncbi:cyclophilin-like domain-containing protein [Syncephalis fuscata]|nr:cyclophilin-like domain-containing protein [Syncephalis fuscata]
MSVLLETSLGDLVIDLEVDRCPRTCLNFLKLCKIKYYNFCSMFRVEKDFAAQTGDPTGSGKGGESVFSLLEGLSAEERAAKRYFPAEIHPKLKHKKRGTVSMAVVATEHNSTNTTATTTADKTSDTSTSLALSGSQFFITLGDELDYLDGRYTVFGHIVEGFEVLDLINDAQCDDNHQPFRDIRIRHTIILDDPFPDPHGLSVPDASPMPTAEQLATVRLGEDESIDDPEGMGPEELLARQRQREAQARALTLEMVGDLPFADIKPPENVLFICKLNPVTQDEDLELIFSRFGAISSCEVIRDRRTNESLCYAFVEFEEREHAEEAYFKMDNVLVDDRRIKVDFSQSVSKLHGDWTNARRARAAGDDVGKGLAMKRQGRQDADQYEMVFEHADGRTVKATPREDNEHKVTSNDRDQQHQLQKSKDKRDHHHFGRSESSHHYQRPRSYEHEPRHHQHHARRRNSRERSPSSNRHRNRREHDDNDRYHDRRRR